MENIDIIKTIATIISTIITFLSSNYILKKPFINKKAYRESLLNVYLPLITIFKKYDPNIPKKKKVSEKNIKKTLIDNKKLITNIIENEFIFFSPYLAEKLYNLLESANTENFYISEFNKVYNIIKSDYIEIKRGLGYPGVSRLQTFLRLSVWNQLKTIFNIILAILISFLFLVFIITLILSVIYGNSLGTIALIFVFFIIAYLLLLCINSNN